MEEEYLFPLKRHRALDPEAADKIAYRAASQAVMGDPFARVVAGEAAREAVERDNEARTPYNRIPRHALDLATAARADEVDVKVRDEAVEGVRFLLTVLAVRGTLGAAQINGAVQQIARAHHAALRDALPTCGPVGVARHRRSKQRNSAILHRPAALHLDISIN